jgi:hypothetical protein
MAELYNYFRDYDPTIGRYIESDPIGLRGGKNTYGYVRGSPLGAKDPRGLFVLKPSCSAQRGNIERAERELQKKLDSSCGGCGGPTGCIPCEHWERIRRAVQTSTVDCSGDDVDYCGEGVRGGNSITLFAMGMNNPQRCGSLKSVLLHEAMHNAGLGSDQHRFINDVELSCFGKDAVERGYAR